MSTEYSSANGYYFTPQPTYNRIKFSVFNALALGAQAIHYWTYCQRNHSSSEYYTVSPINCHGQRNEVWFAIQRINNEIRKITRVFLGSKVLYFKHEGYDYSKIWKTYRVDTNKLENGETVETTVETAENYGAAFPIKPQNLPIECNVVVSETVANLANPFRGVLVSYLLNNPDDTYTNPANGTYVGNGQSSLYIVIVSHDPDNFKKVTISFSNTKYPIKELTPVNLNDAIDGGAQNKIIRTLEPGGYIVFKYEGPLPDSFA